VTGEGKGDGNTSKGKMKESSDTEKVVRRLTDKKKEGPVEKGWGPAGGGY